MGNVIRSLADDILSRLGEGRRMVAIDGVDGSGKTRFSTTLASHIAEHRPAVLVHMDDFLNPRALRYARGRASALGFWLDSYDYGAFTESVLRPLDTTGDGWYRSMSHDEKSDSRVNPQPLQAPDNAVILVEGLFLHRDELVGSWDVSVFLDVSFAVTAARMAARNGSQPDPEHPSMQRYVEGQRLYFDATRPWAQATYVVDNSMVDAPRLISPEQSYAASDAVARRVDGNKT